jgi:hypothetical protein
MKPASKSKEVILMVVAGVEGPSLYLDNRRIAGPKPWGGGKAVYTFHVPVKDIKEALNPSTK